MASPIDLSFSESQLYPGTAFEARVVIEVVKPTKVRNITARLYGYERATVNYSTTGTDGKSETRSETVTVAQVDQEVVLLGDQRKGFFGRLKDSAATLVGGGDHQVLEPGTYEYTVDLKIPENAHPSIKGKLCEVKYSLRVNVDIPVKIDWSKSETLAVRPVDVDFSQSQPAQATYPDEKGRSLWQKSFGKDVTLNLAIDRDCLTTGEEALAILTIESAEPLKVKMIQTRLAGKESTSVKGRSDTSHHKIPLGQIDAPTMIADRSVHEFEICVPELKAPHSQEGSNVSVVWHFETQIYIPWASDPIIRVPITLYPPKPDAELT